MKIIGAISRNPCPRFLQPVLTDGKELKTVIFDEGDLFIEHLPIVDLWKSLGTENYIKLNKEYENDKILVQIHKFSPPEYLGIDEVPGYLFFECLIALEMALNSLIQRRWRSAIKNLKECWRIQSLRKVRF